MAKTRIKSTPMRMQKDALMAMATAAEHAKKLPVPKQRIALTQRHFVVDSKQKPAPTIFSNKPGPSSRSSTTSSTLSHFSDIQSITSGSDSSSPTSPLCISTSPPPSLLSPESSLNHHIIHASNEVIIETSTDTNHLSALLNGNCTDGKPENRKVFMITTNDLQDGVNPTASNGGIGQKRKMLLVMEENPNTYDDFASRDALNQDTAVPPIKKKLTLFTNKSDKEFPQNFEKILPDIIKRIKSGTLSPQMPLMIPANNNVKPNGVVIGTGIATLNESDVKNDCINTANAKDLPKVQESFYKPITLSNTNTINSQPPATVPDKERLPITLPPKKNRTKIIISHQQALQQNQAHKSQTTQNNNSNSNQLKEIEESNYDIEIRPENLIIKEELQSGGQKGKAQVYDIEIQQPTIASKFHKIQRLTPHYQQISAATPVIVTNSNLLHTTANSVANKAKIVNNQVNGIHSPSSSAVSPKSISPSPLYGQNNNNNNINNNNNNNNNATTNLVEGHQTNVNSTKTSTQLRKSANTPPPLIVIKQPKHSASQEISSPKSQRSPTPTSTASITVPQSKNINLSTDFLFLMKMLPKLESIQEPRKTYIKNCIEEILTQNASLFKQLSL